MALCNGDGLAIKAGQKVEAEKSAALLRRLRRIAHESRSCPCCNSVFHAHLPTLRSNGLIKFCVCQATCRFEGLWFISFCRLGSQPFVDPLSAGVALNLRYFRGEIGSNPQDSLLNSLSDLSACSLLLPGYDLYAVGVGRTCQSFRAEFCWRKSTDLKVDTRPRVRV